MRYSKIIFFIIIVSLGLVALYFKYFLRDNHKDVILFENQEDYKRRPVDPGGVIIPHSNSLIYEKLNPSNKLIENVDFLSEPEEPIDLGFKSNLEDVIVYDSIDDILAKIDLNEAATGEDPFVHIDDSINHNKIVTTANDFDINHNPSKLEITKLSTSPNKQYILNSSLLDADYKIQLSSAWSEKEAETEWGKIQLRHIKYLKNTKLVIKKVKVNNNRIIYLIMAGNYPSLNQAKLVCKKLALSKQNCIVTK